MTQNNSSGFDARRADCGAKRRARARTADIVDAAPRPTDKRSAHTLRQSVSWRANASRSTNGVPLPNTKTRDGSISNQFYYGNGSYQDCYRHDEYLRASSPNSRQTHLNKLHDLVGMCFACCYSFESPETPKRQPSMSMREMIDDLLDHESPRKPAKRKEISTNI
jgi:hypothetical protein